MQTMYKWKCRYFFLSCSILCLLKLVFFLLFFFFLAKDDMLDNPWLFQSTVGRISGVNVGWLTYFSSQTAIARPHQFICFCLKGIKIFSFFTKTLDLHGKFSIKKTVTFHWRIYFHNKRDKSSFFKRPSVAL